MKKGLETRDRLIATTGRLLQTQGYFGTGINQILDTSETPRGSFYFHFPGGKEQLAVVALTVSSREWQAKLKAAGDTADTPFNALTNVCHELAKTLVESNYELGCPHATTALETATTVESIRQVCEEHYRSWNEYLIEQIKKTSIPAEHHAATATLVLSAIEGAILLSRVYLNPEPLYQVAAVINSLVSQK